MTILSRFSVQRWILTVSPAVLLSVFVLLQLYGPDVGLARSRLAFKAALSQVQNWGFEGECTVDLFLEERGARLLHSWEDEELFVKVMAVEGKGEVEGSTGSQLMQRYFRSVHKEYCYRGVQGVGAAGAPALAAAVSPVEMRPKIAFMFLTKGVLPFARLWDRFFQGHENLFNVYVHASPFPGVSAYGRSMKHFWGRLIPSDPTERATASLIAAARRLLANALLDDPMNQYFALLSESCIPVRGFRHVYKVITSSNRSFVEQSSENDALWSRYIVRGQEAMLPEIQFSQFRVGSQFWVMLRKHALLFTRDRKYWPKFNLPCQDRWSCFPEEHYFPTVLAIEDPEGSTQFTLTYVDWSVMTGGHPRTFSRDEVCKDLITFFQYYRGGKVLFARKFAEDSIDVLLPLSDYILRD